jgi:uncharacterized Zn finger protein (UPF0148 family)
MDKNYRDEQLIINWNKKNERHCMICGSVLLKKDTCTCNMCEYGIEDDSIDVDSMGAIK